METRGPIEAGLGWCVKEDTGFIGAEAIKVARANGPSEKLVPFVITGPGIARQGNPIHGGGEVTSGTLSPSLNDGIGMAYVPVDKAEPGTELEIDVRGKTRTAEVRAKPLYSKETDPWPTPATPTTSSTTPSTTGRAWTATPPRWASPGTPRTSSARSCSSIRPRSARRSPRTPRTPRSSP